MIPVKTYCHHKHYYISGAGNIEKLKSAAVPDKFNREFLKNLGFTSSNDRAFVSLFRALGLTDTNGAPTQAYRELRQNPARSLAKAVRDTYSEAFAVDESLPTRKKTDIEGVFTRLSDKDETYIKRATATFCELAKIADFKSTQEGVIEDEVVVDEVDESAGPAIDSSPNTSSTGASSEIIPSGSHFHFRHNIEIHLPATKDIGVYNAIFKSIRENLL